MGEVLAIAEEQPAEEERPRPERKVSLEIELPKTKYLFTGKDAWGRKVYFYKMQITGLQERIFGPFDSRSDAIESFDKVLHDAQDAFCNALWFGNPREYIALPTGLKPV